jgi:riboflavin kinase / FMN adenylyltransferase
MIIKGEVEKGKGEARKLGFPTANIMHNKSLETGIFAGTVSTIDGDFDAVIYISNKNNKKVEAHIFDFDADIYGESIIIEILTKIRDDREIKDIKELKNQIKKDIENVKFFTKS